MGMLNSNFNFLSTSCKPWNFQNLRKILEIPEEQLNLLNTIPEWTIGEPATVEKSITLPGPGKKVISEIQRLGNPEGASITKSKLSKNYPSVSEEFPVFLSTSPGCSLKKSVSSSSIHKQGISYISINRSSSLPDLSKNRIFHPVADNQSVILDFHPFVKRDKQNKMASLFAAHNSESITDDLEAIKSNFMDTAIQCKMSQSSQSDIDLSLSSRIATVLSYSETKTINAADDLQWKYKLTTNSLPETSKETDNITAMKTPAIPKTKSVLDMPQVSHNNREPLREKHKEVKEIYSSQSIPCTQPQLSNTSKENISALYPQKPDSALAAKTSKEIESSSIKKSQHSGKRKCKEKSEKMSKKLRSLSSAEITFSSEQIKNMLEVIKILNEL